MNAHSALSALVDAGPAYAFSAHLLAGLRDAGVTHLCICPGSRSAPPAAAAACTPGLRCWTHHDERSAAFFALGIARACAMPVALLCTSGTAAANFAPAVAEASRSSLPLIVLTADRPRRLRARGAPQTIDQVRLYGSHVRAFYEQQPGPDMRGARRRARCLARRLLRRALGARPGPVHANLAFEEPLEPIFAAAPAQTAPSVLTVQAATSAQSAQSAHTAAQERVQSEASHRPDLAQSQSASPSQSAQTASPAQAAPFASPAQSAQTASPAQIAQSTQTTPSTQSAPPVRAPGAFAHSLKAALRLARARRAVRAALARSKRPVFVAGPLEIDAESACLLRRLAERLGAPLLAEPLSQLRSGVQQGRAGGALVAAGDALLRCNEFARRMQPDLVIRLGAPPTGRALSRWLAQHPNAPLLALHTPGTWWRDPERRAKQSFTVEPTAFVRALFADVTGEAAPTAPAPAPESEPHRASGTGPELRHASDSDSATHAAADTSAHAAAEAAPGAPMEKASGFAPESEPHRTSRAALATASESKPHRAPAAAPGAPMEKATAPAPESEPHRASGTGPELRHASDSDSATHAAAAAAAGAPEEKATGFASEAPRTPPAGQGPAPAAEAGWLPRWQRAEGRAWHAVQQSALAHGSLLPAAFAALADALPEDGVLFLSNSLAVRDAETFLPPRAARLRFAANRGANGIDGVLSTACGMAAAGANVGLVIGDLALLHDIGALFTLQRLRLPLRIVVLNDGGGGIFDHLPLAAHKEAVAFEEVFRLAHGQSLVPPARAFGIPAQRCSHAGELKAALAGEGPCLVELPLDPGKNLALHQATFSAVAHAVRAGS